MRIVILTGGTGSIALQRGLYQTIESNLDGIDTKVIVNAYDNGLSTGAVRQVMNRQILGPSDVRKNQVTRLQLQSPGSPWLQFLNHRFTVDPTAAYDFCRQEIALLRRELAHRGLDVEPCDMLIEAVEEYFRSPLAGRIPYEDFSLANIVYSGLAKLNGNSLRTAGRLMAQALRLPDNVLLNDDKSLFLGAITRSGKRVADEGDIVSWNDKSDPFVDIFFVDADAREDRPQLCLEAWQALVEADLIILSAGTQWSSLIPTYASHGFKAAINDSRAKILMVMNRTPDKDSPSQSASDIIDILVPRYFDADRLHVLADESAGCTMRSLSASARAKVASFTHADLSLRTDPPDKHDPHKLAAAIGLVFFRDYIDSDFYLFDYDDTLAGRQNRYPKSSSFNVKGVSLLNSLTNVGICTGNTIRALNLKCASNVESGTPLIDRPLLVFADGGVNKYSYETGSALGNGCEPERAALCISPETLLPTTGPCTAENIMKELRRAGIPASRIDNRGNALIAIKPIAPEHRHAVVSLASHIVRSSNLKVVESGETTVEIRPPALSKVFALNYLRASSGVGPRITYVGDECEFGNDHDVEELAMDVTGVKCLRVGGPAKTAFFLLTLIEHLGQHAKH